MDDRNMTVDNFFIFMSSIFLSFSPLLSTVDSQRLNFYPACRGSW
jgi:hypothetical protein